MEINDIDKLLPDPNQENYEKIKIEHPYNILLKYANAIEKKYPKKLAGIITEAADLTSEKLICYAFYITAAIGNGYSYRLLELEPTTGLMYPIKIKIFEKDTQDLSTVNNSFELEKIMQSVFSMGFTQTLILNLLGQVDLYNESRQNI